MRHKQPVGADPTEDRQSSVRWRFGRFATRSTQATKLGRPQQTRLLLQALKRFAKSQPGTRTPPTTFADCCEIAPRPHADEPVHQAGRWCRAPSTSWALHERWATNLLLRLYTGGNTSVTSVRCLDKAHERNTLLRCRFRNGAGAALSSIANTTHTGGRINPTRQTNRRKCRTVSRDVVGCPAETPYCGARTSGTCSIRQRFATGRRPGRLSNGSLVSYDRKKIRQRTRSLIGPTGAQQTTCTGGQEPPTVDRPTHARTSRRFIYSNATRAT